MKLKLYILGAVIALTACKKEEKLTATGESGAYILPQGNHDYDATIKNYFDKYGSYLLYKFNDRDSYWTPSGWKNAAYDSVKKTWSPGFLVKPADEAYVGKQLKVLDRLWFRFYSDKFLREFLPGKILLCSAVDSVYVGFDFSTTPATSIKQEKSVSGWYNYDAISVNFGSARVDAMTPQDSGIFIWKVNTIFMQSISSRKQIPPTADFTKVTSYATAFTTQAAAYAAGTITDYYSANAQADWDMYILAMTGYPESVLNTSAPNTTRSYVGILNPTKDSSGKIRQRYNMVRNYFITNYNVDLQAIGNAAIAR